MDIDLLGRTSNEIDAILQIMKEVAQLEVPNDGIVFGPASFSGAAIREDADYSGVRVAFTGRLDAARVHMQIDIGFRRCCHARTVDRAKSGLLSGLMV